MRIEDLIVLSIKQVFNNNLKSHFILLFPKLSSDGELKLQNFRDHAIEFGLSYLDIVIG